MSTFVRVVAAGSLSAAARQLNTSQPTISRQLVMLERHLGIQLLNRSTHGLRLTDEGRRYHEYAHGLIAEMAAFEDELRGGGAVPSGFLRVKVPTAFGQDWLVEVAQKYLEACPAVRLEWYLNDAPTRFNEDAIDCAVRVGVLTDEVAIARPIGEVSRHVVASPDLLERHARISEPEELMRLPWIALSTYYTDRLHLQSASGATREIPIIPSFSADHVLSTRTAARMGVGAVLISEWAIREDLAAGTLINIIPQWFGTAVPVYLIYPRARNYPLKLRHFIDLVTVIVPRFLEKKS